MHMPWPRLFLSLTFAFGLAFLGWDLIAAQNADSGSFPSTAFTSPEICGECHTDIYAQWSRTILSRSWTDPYYQAELAKAMQDTNGELANFCIRCHTPIGVMSGEFLPPDGSNLSDIATKGVQCDFCHTVSGIDGISNGSYVNSPGNVKRGPFRDSVSPFHETEFSLLHTRAEFCGICHDIYHPTNGVQLESTYFEWREGPYGKQGIVCQDCHMTPGPGVVKANPGQAAVQGPQREHIFTHYFVGGNALYGDMELATERLQAAARLDIDLPGTRELSQASEFRVTVRNVGAGHYLPTSLTYVRQMWLDVTVHDANGLKVFGSQVMYNTVLEDANGVHDGTVPAWRATHIYSDHRIPPGGSDTQTFRFTAPAGAVAPLSVVAVLNYRSAPPEKTAEYGLPEFPVIEMTRAEARLDMLDTLDVAANPSLIDWAAVSVALPWAAAIVLLVPALLAIFWRRRE